LLHPHPRILKAKFPGDVFGPFAIIDKESGLSIEPFSLHRWKAQRRSSREAQYSERYEIDDSPFVRIMLDLNIRRFMAGKDIATRGSKVKSTKFVGIP
jgi:hypothetical protein